MIRMRLRVAVLTILGLFSMPVIAIAQSDVVPPGKTADAEAVRAATVLTIHGKITEVNKEQRLVTVQVANGRAYTLKVDNPYNLDAATVGTGVVVRYYELITVRRKKADESLPSLSVEGGVTTAEAGASPGAVAEERLKAVVSVVQIDKANGTITIRGTNGSLETAKANDPKVLANLKVGDDLVITAARATAISFKREPASK